MSWKLFLDDQRDPPNDGDGTEWVVVRGYHEAVEMIEIFGFPCFISFDHDLGKGAPTGYDFAKWLINWDMDLPFESGPESPFKYYVHSQNPVGKANIEGLLENYFKFRGFTNES